MRAAIQGAARSRTHPPNRSANEHANTGWSGKATSRSVSPSLKDWSWTGLSMTQASFFSAATSPGSTLSPSCCSCAKHFEVADKASSGAGVAGGAVCWGAAGAAVAFWSRSTGRRGGSGTAAAEAHPAVQATKVMRRELKNLMWLAAISNLVQTGMPLHTSRFPRCDWIALSSSHGAEACNLTSRYPPASLYLSSKFHDRRRDAKHCHRGRHPQEGSRPVGVVHNEKLLAIRPAASDCVIPRHAGKLARQRLTSDDLAGAAWPPLGLEGLTADKLTPNLQSSRRLRLLPTSLCCISMSLQPIVQYPSAVDTLSSISSTQSA